ncbi:uncharacterized protein [Solanum lycopersicum]|uniref:uncharacterized protein n=1 Tax=Solanum lycopersicum TaxID=4081 RepID=UPI003749F23D
MGLSICEKAELTTYQLKNVAQAWYVQWRDNRPLRGGPMTWEILKMNFLDWLFPREMKEEKVVEFINRHQGGRSIHEYSLEFIKFSKYASSLVFNPRHQMSYFVMGVVEELQEKCYSVMLHDNMNISHLMVHARTVEDARDKRKNRYAKRARSFDGGSSNNRLEIQEKRRFKKRVSNQVPYKFPKARDDKGNKLRAKKGQSGNSPNEKPTYAKC